MASQKQQQVTWIASLLAVPLRYQILERLLAGPSIVGNLVEALGENQATVSKQLAILREAGLVACQPDGRCRQYSLANPELVGEVLQRLHDLARNAKRQAERCRSLREARSAH